MTGITAAAGGCVLLATLLLSRQKDEQPAAPQAELSTASLSPVAPTLPTIFPAATQPPATVLDACSAVEASLVERSAWGAKEPTITATGYGETAQYDSVNNPNGWLVYNIPAEEVITTVIIHHSALPLSDGPREIQTLHLEEKGFADVGYQYLIDQAGKTYQGRPVSVRGAHTYGANYGSIGICLIGNFEEIHPTAEQMTALRLLLTCIRNRYPRVTNLAGHRDYNSGTLCPGASLYPLLPALATEFGWVYGV